MVACFKLLLPAVALLATLGEKEEEGKEEEEEKEGTLIRRSKLESYLMTRDFDVSSADSCNSWSDSWSKQIVLGTNNICERKIGSPPSDGCHQQVFDNFPMDCICCKFSLPAPPNSPPT